MRFSVPLALAGVVLGAPIGDSKPDLTTVVIRLKCPDADDLKVCKDFFSRDEILRLAVQRYWVSGLPILRQQKDPAAWLKRHLRVATTGRDTIRVWIRADLPRRDRAALANAALSGWLGRLPSSVERRKFADVRRERRAFEKAREHAKTARQRESQAQQALSNAASRAARAAAQEELATALAQGKTLSEKEANALEEFAKATGSLPFFIVQIADGPHDALLEPSVKKPKRDSRGSAPPQAP